MKLIFEEYGKVIISIIVAVIVLSVVFVGINIFSVFRNEADIKTEFHHQSDEEALNILSQRAKPHIQVADSKDLRFSKGSEFNPMSVIEVTNADNTLVNFRSDGSVVATFRQKGSDAVIKTITWGSDGTVSGVDSEGNGISEISDAEKVIPVSVVVNRIELISYKTNAAGEYVTDAKGQRIQEKKDITSEFDSETNTIMIDKAGTVVVTYTATDLYNICSQTSVSYAVDDVLTP